MFLLVFFVVHCWKSRALGAGGGGKRGRPLEKSWGIEKRKKKKKVGVESKHGLKIAFFFLVSFCGGDLGC